MPASQRSRLEALRCMYSATCGCDKIRKRSASIANDKGEKIRTILTPEEIRDTNALHDFISESLKREIPLKVGSKGVLAKMKKHLLGGTNGSL